MFVSDNMKLFEQTDQTRLVLFTINTMKDGNILHATQFKNPDTILLTVMEYLLGYEFIVIYSNMWGDSNLKEQSK